jgi:SAM-dependent methyltransferase
VHDHDVARVTSEDTDLYGRNYWFGHMEQDLGFANIYERARTDLAERCLHWLRAVLAYRTPPARVLELGSGHGGFVAMLKWAGFDAAGLELSPSIAQIARDLFGVDMLVGPVEEQEIAGGTLDVVALLDVLEHLRDPVATVRHCVSLVKPGGFLLIQTPRFPEGRTFDELTESGDRFVEMLKPKEHLYLYSERSARRLFAEAGFEHVAFEPALFSHYDMFFLVSGEPLSRIDSQERDQWLLQSVSGRMVLGLLDLQDRFEQTVPRAAYEKSEADREARLEVIERQGNQIGELEQLRSSLAGELDGLRRALEAAEADREARLAVIERQGQQLGELAQVRDWQQEIEQFRQALDISEADRAARLEVIERQGRELGESGHARFLLTQELEQLKASYQRSEGERLANLRVVERQARTLEAVQSQLGDIQTEILQMKSSLQSAENARGEALMQLSRQSAELGSLAAVFAESTGRVVKLELLNKEMEQLLRRGIFQLIVDRFRGRS